MMDDTSDSCNVKQSAVSIRLIFNGEVEEHLLGLIDISHDESADGLTRILLSTFNKYGTNAGNSQEKLVGQSYDGVAKMSGFLIGVQARIQRLFPAVYYNHCVAHRFLLCASRAVAEIPYVAKFFGTVDKLIKFLRSSPKRARRLGHNLPKLGDTRWLCRDSAISVVDSCYEEIGNVLYEFSEDKKEKLETQKIARGLKIGTQK